MQPSRTLREARLSGRKSYGPPGVPLGTSFVPLPPPPPTPIPIWKLSKNELFFTHLSPFIVIPSGHWQALCALFITIGATQIGPQPLPGSSELPAGQVHWVGEACDMPG